MKKTCSLLLTLLLAVCVNAQTIYLDSLESFSPLVYGHNLEHTRSAVFKGISAQILRNRKFAGKPAASNGVADQWFSIGDRVLHRMEGGYTKHICLEKMVRSNEISAQVIENFFEGQVAGMGQQEICISAGKVYTLRTVTKVNTDVNLIVELTNRAGNVVYASHNISLKPDKEWSINEFEMTPANSDKDACIRYTFTQRAQLTIGALSMMPKDNFHGMRTDVVANLKAIGPRILRWPGGNFAGEYRWKDGLLPSDMRAPLYSYMAIETQPHSYGYDFHEISTDDFIALCREVGAEPFLTINLAWSTPKESAEWVEYCNGPVDSKYGKIRAENGHPEPYNVKYWSLGNEMGYGHMEGPKGPADYSVTAGVHADSMLKVTPDLNLFSSGPYPNDFWSRYSAVPLSDRVKFISQHAYTGNGYNYTTDEGISTTYSSIVKQVFSFRNSARNMRASLNRTGGKDLKISFDEWNQWYSWYRPSCVGEGILAIRTMHMFITESNKLNIPVVCYFQPVGEGAIIIYPETSRLSANGQMFEIAKEHQDAQLCKVSDNDDYSTVASLKSDILTITLVNYEYEKERTFKFNIKGTVLSSSLYSSKDVLPNSFFDKTDLQVNQSKKDISMTLPAHSAAIVKIKISK